MSLADISLDSITLTLPPSSSSSSSTRYTPSRTSTDSDTDDDQPTTSASSSNSTRHSSARTTALPSLRASLQVPPSTSASTAPPGIGGAPSARLGPSLTSSDTTFLVPAPPSSFLKPSPASTLRIPPAPGGSAGGGGLAPSLAPGQARAEMPTGKRRTKVALAPGCSALDWARLKSTEDLRGGITTVLRVTPSELKKHKSPDDVWSVFNNKVYNLTAYLRFHPGGGDEVMRVAGRDGTRLFMLTHSWVNIDSILDGTLVGVLVKEP
ncbi:unnamed protein product [Tilletia controversa]|uniref:Cytochrome b5 heme-binding domain-containing protein n=3 Tax=Tilletia TaxID=13289 RepID=A0A8X7MXI5_9BASI|nr:hypothetical protein CF336_g5406 [Tilletia laevis]KAE8193668.1 hypothetical protein CF328_g4982 [Tilletia controversa]KAE8265016.1 hypothetical protein A4X03_0g539 [Tilletia caries]KAE8193720.1 hypothetical protein CF335_g5520 [Tilletia laevis]KAE8251767.1 hypothetical protein A4X06_0g2540 [Tilletia controversa]